MSTATKNSIATNSTAPATYTSTATTHNNTETSNPLLNSPTSISTRMSSNCSTPSVGRKRHLLKAMHLNTNTNTNINNDESEKSLFTPTTAATTTSNNSIQIDNVSCPTSDNRKVCQHFLTGSCKFGSRCRRRHNTTPTPTADTVSSDTLTTGPSPTAGVTASTASTKSTPSTAAAKDTILRALNIPQSISHNKSSMTSLPKTINNSSSTGIPIHPTAATATRNNTNSSTELLFSTTLFHESFSLST